MWSKQHSSAVPQTRHHGCGTHFRLRLGARLESQDQGQRCRHGRPRLVAGEGRKAKGKGEQPRVHRVPHIACDVAASMSYTEAVPGQPYLILQQARCSTLQHDSGRSGCAAVASGSRTAHAGGDEGAVRPRHGQRSEVLELQVSHGAHSAAQAPR